MGRPRELSPEERADLISRGYRPVEIWIPDTDDKMFQEQLQQEARQIAVAPEEDEIMDWIAAVGPDNWDKP
ncbi:hypothetical protein ASG39_01055 [Rhizobium sp. Leaf371]|uniref:antitoxin MazE-like protein n=1 Tax=Rhizobium sp. Leaf371 TaxID=1736355 RepID=UPI00071432BD|nr:antitoxin MazE-like protein [Rhizobium sp. Leaf371]KQS72400.1 hypothetical protein ASG39_01055 [Rhizobium sp. Leaf371]